MANVKCPKCGELNKSLNLEETKGWYECSKCGSVMQVFRDDSRHAPAFPLSNGKTSPSWLIKSDPDNK